MSSIKIHVTLGDVIHYKRCMCPARMRGLVMSTALDLSESKVKRASDLADIGRERNVQCLCVLSIYLYGGWAADSLRDG